MSFSAPPKTNSPLRLTVLLCLAEVLIMLNNAFPGMLPQFQALWGLSNGEAGWLSGMYYGGYILATLPLVALTDARDARTIYLCCAGLSALSSFAFALLADGFWSALVLRILGGMALAGTYMVGLRILTDRTEGRAQSRAIAFYTAHFAMGSAISLWVAGTVVDWIGWEGAYHLSGIGGLLALLIVFFAVSPGPPKSQPLRWRETLDLRPALRNKRSLGFNLAYACHGWELFAFRSFILSFLVFATAGRADALPLGLSPTDLAGIALVLGLPGSVIGNELGHRFGRVPMLTAVMVTSGLLGLSLAFAASGPIWLLVVLLLCYGVTVSADSSLLTGGAIAAAAKDRRGVTLALHSLLGFAASAPAPVAFGYVLDMGGGEGNHTAWILAFAVLSFGIFLGPVLLRYMTHKADAEAAEAGNDRPDS